MTPALSSPVERGDKSGLFAATLPRMVAAIALFSAAGLVEARQAGSVSSLSDSDIWWHLSSGLWMLQHQALPRSGILSQAAGQSWIAASWLYDLKLAIFYKVFGLRTIPIFAMSLKAGVSIIAFLLAGGRRGSFWVAASVSAIAQYVLAALPATPAYASVVFFGIELLLLLEMRRAHRMKLVFWLPPLFLVWANVDVQFVYGLGLVILFLISLVLERLGSDLGGYSFKDREWIRDRKVRITLAIGAAFCVVATVITPYFYHVYGVFLEKTFSAANPYLEETYAPGFRQPHDYVLMLFVMCAFLVLGMRRSRDPFLIGVLVLSTALAFHSRRDIWLVALAVCAVMGETNAKTSKDCEAEANLRVDGLRGREFWIAVGAAVLVVALSAAILIPREPGALLAKASENYPVGACDYIRQNHLPQPVFNALEWGGFLTWYLPEYPVAIDGRIDLYGGEFIVQYSQMMNAGIRYTEFPPIANAETIVLPQAAIMAQALSSLPAYKVVYRDKVAMVLSRVI